MQLWVIEMKHRNAPDTKWEPTLLTALTKIEGLQQAFSMSRNPQDPEFEYRVALYERKES